MNQTFLNTLALSGGDWVIWGLYLCSVIAVAIMIERGVVLVREARDFRALRAGLLRALAEDLSGLEKAVHRHHGAASRILKAGLTQAGRGAAGVEDMLASATLEERLRLEKRLLVLGTLGNNAPFIGLFGTVLGVIKAFHDLSQLSAGPEVVMKGLSEALIATAVGLFVAIPCVVGFNYFQKKVRDLMAGTEALARLMLAQIRAGKEIAAKG
ncbi:MAG: MotA/TolQ/ExbB proton channel family protein [Elusimicrobia bacterium]|nr:MotA/TolQ/ExbB proton channel family protein [Elusimicrobiota bacterium]